MSPRHLERHLIARVGWLRASVLGANDGIVSTASLIVGVASSGQDRAAILIAGLAGLVAGAMSMAAGEYISVSSQADAESADLARERKELASQPQAELEELTNIYVARGVELETARQVARQLTSKDALEAHARDELGISEATVARPIQAAIASALMFTCGAALPLAASAIVPRGRIELLVTVVSLASLALLGAVGARAGGAPVGKAVVRVVFWGGFAMALTAGVGALFGVAA